MDSKTEKRRIVRCPECDGLIHVSIKVNPFIPDGTGAYSHTRCSVCRKYASHRYVVEALNTYRKTR